MKKLVIYLFFTLSAHLLFGQMVVEKGVIWKADEVRKDIKDSKSYIQNLNVLKNTLETTRKTLDNIMEAKKNIEKNLRLADKIYKEGKKVVETIPKTNLNSLWKYAEKLIGRSLNPKDYLPEIYEYSFMGDLMKEFNIEPIDFEFLNITYPEDTEIYALEFADQLTSAMVKKFKKDHKTRFKEWEFNLKKLGRSIKTVEHYCTSEFNSRRRRLDVDTQKTLFILTEKKENVNQNIIELSKKESEFFNLMSYNDKNMKIQELKDELIEIKEKELYLENKNLAESIFMEIDFLRCMRKGYERELRLGEESENVQYKNKDQYMDQSLKSYMKKQKERLKGE